MHVIRADRRLSGIRDNFMSQPPGTRPIVHRWATKKTVLIKAAHEASNSVALPVSIEDGGHGMGVRINVS